MGSLIGYLVKHYFQATFFYLKLSENSGPANSFCPENVVCFLNLLHIQVHFSKDFIMEANTLSPEWSSLISLHIVYISGYLRT